MSDKEESNASGGIWFCIFLFGIIVYLTIVMPLRIIFRNRENSMATTLMPFSNIFSLQAMGSFFMYGMASGFWLTIGCNIYQGYGEELQGAMNCFIFFGIVSVIFSIILAYNDVKDSMDLQG